MAKVLEVDGTGVRAGSLGENQRRLNEKQREAFGSDLAMSPQTPQAQWSGIGAAVYTEIGEAGVRVGLYGASVDDAPGTYLDVLGGLLDVRRRVATRSRVTATLTGENGTGVPAGSLARTDPDGHLFATVADAVLSASGVGVEMQAVEVGAVPAPAGTLTEIVTVIVGWETITNAADAVLGRARQADAAYRETYLVRTAHSSIGPVPAIKAALEEALAGKTRVVENRTSVAVVRQEWTISGHALLVVAESGVDTDVTRAVENHRGMGVPTMTAILGGAADETALAMITNGTVEWDGDDYPGLNLSTTTTPAERAAALTTLLAGTGVVVSYIGSRYVAIFEWDPDHNPTFGDGAVETAFALAPAAARYPTGPFVRPDVRDLSVSMTLTRRTGFPSNGLDLVRSSVLARVAAYEVGEQVWANDLLCEAERVAGTRITALTVQHAGADVSAVAIPLDVIWRLTSANLAITVA